MGDFSKIIILEKAKREVERSAIDDNLKTMTGMSNFGLDELVSECSTYIPFVPCSHTILLV